MSPKYNSFSPTWTKYICTLGPASDDPNIIEGLVKAGASFIRNNFAHTPFEEYKQRKEILDEINQRLGTNVQMQADLQGLNIRVGSNLPDDGLQMNAGEEYVFHTAASQDRQESDLFINDATLQDDVKVGEPITFMDGALEGEIIGVDGAKIKVRMINSAKLKPRKSVNVPQTQLSASGITEKDRRDLEFLLETGIDWIALSFISNAQEINEVRQIIGDRPVKIISKVERRQAIDNIIEIVDASDAVMIARGDLGIELPLEEIPILQRSITALCKYSKTPVITATQMLLSMTQSRRPTRAEVSDVANAVFAKSDALMLSEETAVGMDPVNALSTMVTIAKRVEDYMYRRQNYFDTL